MRYALLGDVIVPRIIVEEGIPADLDRGAGTTTTAGGAVTSGEELPFGKIRPSAVHAQLER